MMKTKFQGLKLGHIIFLVSMLYVWNGSIAMAQQFRGYIRDQETRTPIYGAQLYTHGGKLYAQTDSMGRFVFHHTDKKLEVTIFYQGYEQKKVKLSAGLESDIYLSPLYQELEGVTITASGVKRGNNDFDFTPQEARKIPAIIGEVDVMRYIQILPGVSLGMEGGMSYFVRGAGNGNNRVELDGVPVFGTTHLFGLLSAFHSDIVDYSEFQMGGIPASSGDMLSSLLQIHTASPKKRGLHGSVSVSPLIVGSHVRGRLWKDKISVIASGRISFLRPEFLLLRKILGKDRMDADVNPQVADGLLKIQWHINPIHEVEAMWYGTHDYLSMTQESDSDQSGVYHSLGWNNQAINLSWIYKPSADSHFETRAYYSSFSSQLKREEQESIYQHGIFIKSGYSEWAVKSQYFLEHNRLKINGGIDLKKQTFRPLIKKMFATGEFSPLDTLYNSYLSSLFGEVLCEKEPFLIKAGLRYNLYQNRKMKLNSDTKAESNEDRKLFHDLEFRLRTSAFLTQNSGVEFTYDRLTQFRHVLEGLPIGWSMDPIIPASDQFRPEKSDQLYLGGFWKNPQWRISLGTYYRRIQNIISNKNPSEIFSNQNISWKENWVSGIGRSKGMELWVEKRGSRWTGSLAYTLSKTTRRFDEINGGFSFPFKFDRTHNLNFQTQYKVIDGNRHKQYANMSLYFTSGNCMTIARSAYYTEPMPYWFTTNVNSHPERQEYHASVRTEMSAVNAHRMPNYFRIDVGYSFFWHFARVKHELALSIFNLTNRHNPYLVYYNQGAWKQVSILPFLPTIRWSMSF